MDEILELQEIDQNAYEAKTAPKLIVRNDDVNTFEHVIVSLMEICNHTMEQAEQCAHLIHHTGKTCVKEGGLSRLKPMKDALTDRGINAIIEG